MTDTNNPPKKDALKLSSPSTLSLTKTVESGKVKQNFQRGRSKTVTVEVKKTRTFTAGKSGMVEVERGASEATKQRMLNQAEREARLRALQQAEKANDEVGAKETFSNFERDVAEAEDNTLEADEMTPEQAMAAAKTSNYKSPMDELAARNLERLRNAPSNRSSAAPAVAKPAKAKPNFTSPTPKVEEEVSEKEKAKKARAGEEGEYKRGGKLPIAQALGMDDDIKVRSLSAVKRQRAKVQKKAHSVPSSQQEKIIREVQIPEVITVQELANRMAERAVDVIKESCSNSERWRLLTRRSTRIRRKLLWKRWAISPSAYRMRMWKSIWCRTMTRQNRLARVHQLLPLWAMSTMANLAA